MIGGDSIDSESESAQEKGKVQPAGPGGSAGRDPAILHQYENHAIEPDISILCDMADFLHVSIDFLVGREYSDEDKTHIVTAHISQQEHSLLEKYRALGPSEQKCVDTVVNTLLEKA